MDKIEVLYENLKASIRDERRSKDEVIGWADGGHYFVHSIEDALNYIEEMELIKKSSTPSNLSKQQEDNA